MVGIYLAAVTGMSLVANLLYGRFSMRLGNPRIMVLASSLGLALSLLVLSLALLARPLGILGTSAAVALLPVYAPMSARDTSIGVAGCSLYPMSIV
jgi:hypothetical protein